MPKMSKEEQLDFYRGLTIHQSDCDRYMSVASLFL